MAGHMAVTGSCVLHFKSSTLERDFLFFLVTIKKKNTGRDYVVWAYLDLGPVAKGVRSFKTEVFTET